MRFRKDPGRPGPVGALAECFGAIAGPVDGRRSGPGDHLPHSTLKCNTSGGGVALQGGMGRVN